MPGQAAQGNEVMPMKLKKKYLILIAGAILIILTASTLAYFTNSDLTTNRFVGKEPQEFESIIEISVAEEFDPPEEKNDAPFRKNVQIENTGTVPCYIRVRMEFSSSAVRDISWISTASDQNDESAYVNAGDFPFSALPAGWEYRAEDGFYYYTEAVEPREKTRALMKWVKTLFPDDSSVDADSYDIYVYSEAVPADDADGERLTYEEAWR